MDNQRLGKKVYPERSRRVAVGVSGGVDSAVAAALLKKQGYEVIGVHLYCYDEGSYCTAPEDRRMAVRVAKELGIPLQVWDLRKEYKERVIRYFLDEYKKGWTPNPDIVCNREIKFGLFMEKAFEELQVDYVATGHYARIVRQKAKGRRQSVFSLLRGVDEGKDQSYFLYNLTQKHLEHILFPIGDYRKSKVRELAKEFGLPNYSRRDSMGVCFIGPVPIAKFLREHIPSKQGPVVNTKGEIIGEHDGVWFFTEGQRHGFKIFPAKGGSSLKANAPREHASGGKLGLPLYVISKDVATNTLVVGRGEESKVKEFWVENLQLVNPNYKTRSGARNLKVRIRHLGELMPCKFDARLLKVTLKAPVAGVAPGQSVVFYQKDEVLGGGVIQSAKPVVSGSHH